MSTETFSAARARILRELGAQGWTTSPSLKVPWASPRSGAFKLWFKPQAVYLNDHSLWIDIRGMPLDTFLAHVQHAVKVRFGSRRRRTR
jgi:hypothetical protein